MPPLRIRTTRFGFVTIEPEDVVFFPLGMLGLDGCLHWVLLADADNDALGWLQCITRAEIALAVVRPRRFVPDYQVRITRSELGPLALDPVQDAQVLVIVNKNERSITLNLKAPLIINLQRRIGRQVVTNVDQPLQYELSYPELSRKKIA